MKNQKVLKINKLLDKSSHMDYFKFVLKSCGEAIFSVDLAKVKVYNKEGEIEEKSKAEFRMEDVKDFDPEGKWMEENPDDKSKNKKKIIY